MNPSEAEQIMTNPKTNTTHKNREIIGVNCRDPSDKLIEFTRKLPLIEIRVSD